MTYAQPPEGMGPGGPHGGRDRGGPMGAEAWILRHEATARELGVSEQQIQTLKDAAYKTEQAMIRLRQDVELANLELRKLMQSEEVTQQALNKAVEAAGEAQTEMRKLQMWSRIQARELLGADTLAKIRTKIRNEFRDRAGAEGGGRGRMMKGRGMQGPDAVDPDEVEVED